MIREERRLSLKSANYWALIYRIPAEEVAALTNPGSSFRLRPHPTASPSIAAEAKSIVALSFRNGPIEDVHAGRVCPTCAGKPEYSHITDEEMKRIMKRAVDRVYTLLSLKAHEPEAYAALVDFGNLYTASWDDPEFENLEPHP